MGTSEAAVNPLSPVEDLIEQVRIALREGDAEGAASAAASAGARLEAITAAALAGEMTLPVSRLHALRDSVVQTRQIVDTLARLNGAALEQLLQLGSQVTYGEAPGASNSSFARGLQCWNA